MAYVKIGDNATKWQGVSHVLLDGNLVNKCVEANEEAGYVRVLTGEARQDPASYEFFWESRKLEGKVEIIWK